VTPRHLCYISPSRLSFVLTNHVQFQSNTIWPLKLISKVWFFGFLQDGWCDDNRLCLKASSTVLPEFSLDYLPQIDHAREDKISIDIGGWFVNCQPSTIRSIRAALGQPPANSETPEHYGWLFQQPNHNNDTEPMKVRHFSRGTILTVNNASNAPYPLFTGTLKTSVVSTPQTRVATRRYKFNARLYLNPLRYARHQFAVRPANIVRAGSEMLCHGFSPQAAGGELPLDREIRDNFLPMAGRMFQIANDPTQWHGRVVGYLRSVRNVLGSELRRAVQQNGAQLEYPHMPRTGTPVTKFNVREVEITFDFRHEDPLGQIHALEPSLRILSSRTTRRDYGLPANGSVRDLNCISWTFHFRRGIAVKLYAKTTRRIRLEICYDLSERDGRHTFQSLAGVFRFLHNLRQDALTHVADFFARLRALSPPDLDLTSPLGFLREWFATIPKKSQNIGPDLLLILVHNLQICLADNDPMRSAVLALRRRGLLRFNGTGDEVTEQWQSAFGYLRYLLPNERIRPARVRSPALHASPQARVRPYPG